VLDYFTNGQIALSYSLRFIGGTVAAKVKEYEDTTTTSIGDNLIVQAAWLGCNQ
jgi:hypothetical protein